MTKSEILKAAEMCCHNECSVDCPMMAGGKSCREVFAKYILEQEKEPAPQEAGTSSQKNYLQEYNTALLENCQAKIGRTLDFMASMRSDMGDVDKTLWNMGKAARMLEEIREELR